VALRVSASPTSISAKVFDGTVYENVSPCLVLWAIRPLATVGASLVLATPMLNEVLALAPAMSLAVTTTLSEPTSPLAGVPENVPLEASKLSQLGSADPSACVALNVNASPASTSAKVLAETT